MTKREIYQIGYERGYNIASWQDMPLIGSNVPRSIIHDTVETIQDVNDREDVFYALCYEAEENDRSYTPFEFLAHDLNELQEKKPYDVWIVFDDGISAGIRKSYKERTRKYKA